MQAPCHKCDRAPAWLAADRILSTKYTTGCEPYVITLSEAAPRYDERFRGYHTNKVRETQLRAADSRLSFALKLF